MEETNTIIDQGTVQQSTAFNVKEPLPNAGGILAMGIISIVFAGMIGIILGIISISLGGTALRNVAANPEKYTQASIKNARAGRTCGIIGLCISGLVLLIILAAVIANA